MPSVNLVVIAGHLTRDPELRHTPKGTAVASFGVAINRAWIAEGGEKKEEVVFVDVVTWGGTAEACSRHLRKGSPALVEGRLQLDQWEDKQSGEKRSKLGVVAESVQFLASAPKTEGKARR